MKSNLVIMGLPASGKTTLLAALWHLVVAEEAECRLTLDEYRGDLAYLNMIAEAWRNFKPMTRTSQVGDADVNVTLRLRDTVSGNEATVFFPDLAGENFDTQVEERRCRPAFVDSLEEEDGILFFITADVKGDALSIVDFNASMPPDMGEDRAEVPPPADEERAGVGETDGQPGEAAEPATLVEWSPRMIPSQVRITQILGDLLRLPFTARKRRIAVLISAWDLVKDRGVSPAEWLATEMPLVDQFLRSNSDWFEAVIYGVSAQGVSLKDRPAVEQATQVEPSRRILIVGPEGTGSDLTLPLVSLMSPV